MDGWDTAAIERAGEGAVRERLERRGPAAPRDEELLAVLLAGPRDPAPAEVERALGWLATAGGLAAVAEALRQPGRPLPGRPEPPAALSGRRLPLRTESRPPARRR